jgi:hypothetical protein
MADGGRETFACNVVSAGKRARLSRDELMLLMLGCSHTADGAAGGGTSQHHHAFSVQLHMMVGAKYEVCVWMQSSPRNKH